MYFPSKYYYNKNKFMQDNHVRESLLALNNSATFFYVGGKFFWLKIGTSQKLDNMLYALFFHCTHFFFLCWPRKLQVHQIVIFKEGYLGYPHRTHRSKKCLA